MYATTWDGKNQAGKGKISNSALDKLGTPGDGFSPINHICWTETVLLFIIHKRNRRSILFAYPLAINI
ncbi:MAG: hypothetical protein RR051_03785, partial [Clostridiales bacterium]